MWWPNRRCDGSKGDMRWVNTICGGSIDDVGAQLGDVVAQKQI
jgi:hypothetical protein